MTEPTPEWLTLEHEETHGQQRVPGTLSDADLEYWAARGWHPVDTVDDGTPPGVPAPPNTDGGTSEWVELVHPLLGARHQFPNNSAAVEGAHEAGWVEPNKDGSVPKRAARKAARDAGVDIDDLPATDDGEPATEESGGEPAAGESDHPASDDRSATSDKEG